MSSNIKRICEIYNNLQKRCRIITMRETYIQDELESIPVLNLNAEQNLEIEFNKLEQTYISMKETLDRIENILKETNGSDGIKRSIQTYFANIDQESHW